MLLTITTTKKPATDLGYLLHKNPSRVHSFSLPWGEGHVFFPDADIEKCTACLLVEIDPINLIRKGQDQNTAFPLKNYVNDRPYVASSFLSVAIAKIFGAALKGRSKERPELAKETLPLEINIPVLPCNKGEEFLRKLFDPLGYEVATSKLPLDEKFSEWGDSDYFSISLKCQLRLSDVLSHLYILIPVLDNDKHYWIAEDEVNKLLDHGALWLKTHPERNLIIHRYVKKLRSLSCKAFDILNYEDALVSTPNIQSQSEKPIDKKTSLNEERLNSVMKVLEESGATSVIDLGCGDGKLIKKLLPAGQFKRILGVDVSMPVLGKAKLRIGEIPKNQTARLEFIQGSLIYKDRRFDGFDIAVVMEVIEHLDLNRLTAFERVIFEVARPKTVVITTPNSEYNEKFIDLTSDKYRHSDHRFEWSRKEFEDWSKNIGQCYGYEVAFHSIGPIDPQIGAPTQMGVFES